MGQKSYMLSRRDANRILDTIQSRWPAWPGFRGKAVQIVKMDNERALLLGEGFTAVKLGEEVIPFLKMEEYLGMIGTIVVDPGAIRFVCNGANVMRPGVVRWTGEFKEGDIVAVKEAGHDKLIAVGLALVASSELGEMDKGVVVKNLHYVGDPFWEAFKTVG